ncbi:MAG: holo-[acyl-carrier-protein] synthase, partial [Gammaproteobacteria bacterium]|nr:holo-[acyl-carrier-protein] synthase [Gammaproteobacteria bacterium]
MIFGIGTDILRIERIAAAHARYGERFVHRILMPEEMPGFAGSGNPVRYLAMRFAAKEAIVKAVGTGFAHGMWLRDSGILPDPRGP